jgi:hypothetical protein
VGLGDARSWLYKRCVKASCSHELFPVAADRLDSGLRLRLRRIPVAQFQDPFCHETIRRNSDGTDFELFFSRSFLANVLPLPTENQPRGLIFHMARCGSTLQTQLLKTIDDLAVYSEPPVFNDILMPPVTWTRSEVVGALRIVGLLLDRHANRNFIVKPRSWNVLFSDEITEAFPYSPWIFSIRNPVEVGVSVLRRPPTWIRSFLDETNPFVRLVGISEVVPSLEEYAAHVLASFCESIERLDKSRGALVHYHDLPEALWKMVLPHFGITATEREIQQMIGISKTHAKSAMGKPVPFLADSVQKQHIASPALRAAMTDIAAPAISRVTEALTPAALRI